MKRIKQIVLFVIAAALLLSISAVGFVYLAPETAARTFLAMDRSRSGLVRKEIDLPDGTRYVYLEGGQGEPLMMLHGFGANKDSFVRIARYLTGHYRVIIPDHVGFGESSHPPDADYSPTGQAVRLHSLAKELALSNLNLAGNSMGGQIALTYAAKYPGEVSSLWLLDTAGLWTAPKSEYRKMVETTGQNPLLVRTEEDFAQLLPWVMTNRPFVPRPILDVIARERIRNYDLEKRIFQQLFEDSIEERVRDLSTPSLIVWGDEDRLISVETAEILHNLLPNSQVVIMPKVGHVPQIERPQQTADDYLRFRGAEMITPVK